MNVIRLSLGAFRLLKAVFVLRVVIKTLWAPIYQISMLNIAWKSIKKIISSTFIGRIYNQIKIRITDKKLLNIDWGNFSSPPVTHMSENCDYHQFPNNLDLIPSRQNFNKSSHGRNVLINSHLRMKCSWNEIFCKCQHDNV